MKLNWGKNRIDFKPSVNGAPQVGGDWSRIEEIRENTTQLTTTEGTDLEAKIEGGEVIDSLPGANSYKLEFEVFVEKGGVLPFADNNGVVQGNWSLRVIPVEDEACPAIAIDNCTIKAVHDYNTTDAWRVKYIATVLKPASGNSVKPYSALQPVSSSFTLKVDDVTVATEATSEQPELTGGDVELTITGTDLNAAHTAHLVVGDNIINLTKSNASTSTSAIFEGVTSSGDLEAVVMEGQTLLSF